MTFNATLSALSCALTLGLATSAQANVLPAQQTESNWFKTAAANIEHKSLAHVNTQKAKNIILFIGDGMGVSTLTAARIFQGQAAGDEGEENLLSFEAFPHTALVKTYNTNQQTPDSAGTMTAMITGVKNKAGVLSLGPEALRGNCAASKGNELATIMMLAEEKAKTTGIVSTARVTHATPAATYAHSPERGWESNDKLPQEAIDNGCKDIASQLIDFPYGDGIDVVLGGGKRHFIPQEDDGKRTDNRNLISEWKEKHPQGNWVENTQQLASITNNNKLFGLFSSSHMSYETDRDTSETGQPSLAAMTTKAVDVLSANDEGFVLMVEGGRIDHGHHAGNAYRALSDATAFSDAVQAVLDHNNINLDETLIIVTADHSHVFTIAGYPAKGNPILGHVADEHGEKKLARDDKPYTTVGYANGLGFADLDVGGDTRYGHPHHHGRVDTSAIDPTHQGYHQEALVPLRSETHSGEDVSLHAQGPFAHLFQGVIEQNTLFHVINHAANLSAKKY